MDVTKTYEFIGFRAMDVIKPYEFIRFGAMDVTTLPRTGRNRRFTKVLVWSGRPGGTGTVWLRCWSGGRTEPAPGKI